jgi:hypothetical protein
MISDENLSVGLKSISETLIFILVNSINVKSQNTNSIKRNPDSRKDYVNLFFDPNYTLFDFW